MSWILAIFSCQGSEKTEGAGEAGVLIRSGVFQLDWDMESEPASELSIENNLGYQIEVSRGYFSSYSVRLYPCVEISSAQLILPISSASAGHSDILIPGNWMNPIVEDLLNRDNITQEKSFEEHQVCELVYTLARADGSSQNLPEDIELENLSIYVEGTWRKDGAEQRFMWVSNLPAERVFSLDNCTRHEHYDDGKGMVIQLTRDISGVFDNIDFANGVDEQNGALQMLTNLVQDTQLHCWNF